MGAMSISRVSNHSLVLVVCPIVHGELVFMIHSPLHQIRSLALDIFVVCLQILVAPYFSLVVLFLVKEVTRDDVLFFWNVDLVMALV